MTALDLVFKKIESEDKPKYDIFFSHLKKKKKSMTVTLMMYLNKSTIISNIQKSLGKGSG